MRLGGVLSSLEVVHGFVFGCSVLFEDSNPPKVSAWKALELGDLTQAF